MTLPRGIRNHNPGNIRHSTQTVWVGESKTQEDKSFVTFRSPEYGLRAVMKILITYYNKYALLTIRMIINRYAPPIENDTESYIQTVSKISGIKPDDVIDDVSTMLIPLAKAISLHENGYPQEDMPDYWYSDEMYEKAKHMALA